MTKDPEPSHYSLPRLVQAPTLSLPAGKRVTRGWQAIPIAPAGTGLETSFTWDTQPEYQGEAGWLRLTVAIDDRESKRLRVYSAKTRSLLGEMEIRQAHAFQPFQIALEPASVRTMIEEGFALHMQFGRDALWIFYSAQFPAPCPPLMPHLLVGNGKEPLAEFIQRMTSLASMQFFGWQEGCVLDGLSDLAQCLPWTGAAEAINLHFSQFFDRDGKLVAEDDYSRPVDGEIYGIEATLPYAVLAQIDPDHPILGKVVQYWRDHLSTDGLIQDTQASYLAGNFSTTENPENKVTTAEGAYTIAYPMAVIASSKQDANLAQMAIDQIRLRKKVLVDPEAVYLRRHADGSRSFRNWSRGVAWYFLGLVRTLSMLPPDVDVSDLQDETLRVARFVISRQLDTGLWPCFIDQPAILPDTAGSSGIATALALGYRYGYLGSEAYHSALRAWQALTAYLTPDGFLDGVAQANKGGEALQISAYRVLSQFGMGLYAQLLAAILPEGISSVQEATDFLNIPANKLKHPPEPGKAQRARYNPNQKLIMGIDGGQTKTSCILATLDGDILGEGRAGPVLHLAMQDSEAQFLGSVGSAIQAAWESAGISPQNLAALGLGLTGVTGGSIEAQKASHLARQLVEAGEIAVESDVFASLLGAHAGSEGIVIVSGTGSIAMGITADGKVARSGGWGWIMGDEGSACWIGRKGLSAALRAYDQTGPQTQLLEVFLAYFQVKAVHDIKRLYMASDFGARGFGRLAPLVAEAAGKGDRVAQNIIGEAADELSLAVFAILEKLTFQKLPVPLAAIGGAFEHLPGLKNLFDNRITQSKQPLRLVQVEFPPPYGPLFLAMRACNADLEQAIPNLRKSLGDSHTQLTGQT